VRPVVFGSGGGLEQDVGKCFGGHGGYLYILMAGSLFTVSVNKLRWFGI
jgi:hypothetical protein